MQINPVAFVFWSICAGIGYLIGGIDTAILWAVVAASISTVLSFISFLGK